MANSVLTLFKNSTGQQNLPRSRNLTLLEQQKKIEARLERLRSSYKACETAFYQCVDDLRAIQNNIYVESRDNPNSPKLHELNRQAAELSKQIHELCDPFEKAIETAAKKININEQRLQAVKQQIAPITLVVNQSKLAS